MLVVAAAILVAVWQLRGSQTPSTAPTQRGRGDAPATETTPAGTPKQRPALRSAAGSEAKKPEPPALPDGTSATSIDMPPTIPMAEVLRRIPPLMKRAAKPCFNPQKHPANSAERVSFRYTVEYLDGRAHVRDVAPMDSNIDDETLQNCILDRVERLSWDAAGLPDRKSRRQQLSISIYDLSR